jgi:hypothetical protein
MIRQVKIKFWQIFIISTIALSSPAMETNFSPASTIWFDAPATNFTESSPMGNGRLGAMAFGG